MNGIEMMFKSLGLGEVITMAKQLVDSGAADKILAFADALPRIEQKLDRILLLLEAQDDGIRSSFEPGPGSGTVNSLRLLNGPMSDANGTDRQS